VENGVTPVALTERRPKNLQPTAKGYKVADPDNRFPVMVVHPSGRKVLCLRRKVGRVTGCVTVGNGFFPYLEV